MVLYECLAKFSPRARNCVFLGFRRGVKGFKLYDFQTEEVFVSRDVLFYESIFPFAENTNSPQGISLVPLPTSYATDFVGSASSPGNRQQNEGVFNNFPSNGSPGGVFSSNSNRCRGGLHNSPGSETPGDIYAFGRREKPSGDSHRSHPSQA